MVLRASKDVKNPESYNQIKKMDEQRLKSELRLIFSRTLKHRWRKYPQRRLMKKQNP